MRKVVVTIITILAVLTLIVVGLTANQNDLIPTYLSEMVKAPNL